MRTMFLIATAIAISGMAVLATAQSSGHQTPEAKTQIPKSIQAEHLAIHSMLVEATRVPGRVGAAAKTLAEVLDPHFEREEEIALPPLGVLAPLAARTKLTDAQATEVLAMSDSLRRELPRMLDEHKRIRAAVDGLRQAAKAERAVKYEQLADDLAMHAQTEEEIMYPAAVLVGDLIRAARQAR